MAVRHHRRSRAPERGDRLTRLRRLTGFSGPLIFVVVILSVMFVMSVFFRVSDIRIEGNVHYTDEEIIRAIDIEEGDNLFLFDRFAAISRVMTKLPYVEKVVSIERRLPNRVTITIVESQAMAYIALGDEKWTLDHNCKVLGQAAEGEEYSLIPIRGFSPGTLYIGEPLKTEDDDQAVVDYLAEILYQMDARRLASSVTGIDFSDPYNVEFTYGGKYTVVLGRDSGIEHKFGMFVTVMDMLKEGDIGVIDVSDGNIAHFTPN